MKDTKKHNPRVVIEYLPNYKVKYSFYKEPLFRYDGKGWNEIVGYKIMCHASKLYPNQDPTSIPIEELDKERKEAYILAKYVYENSKLHHDRMKSYKKLIEDQSNRFDSHELINDDNRKDLQKWVDNSELIGLVDEKKGGIIGYINKEHIEEIIQLLNKTQ